MSLAANGENGEYWTYFNQRLMGGLSVWFVLFPHCMAEGAMVVYLQQSDAPERMEQTE